MKIKLNPDIYHGSKKEKNFFEGWYFKLVTKDNLYSIAFIPGVTFNINPQNNGSFIQVLQGHNKIFNYCKYKITDFKPSPKSFVVQIENNYFSLSKMQINIDRDNLKASGTITFNNIIKWDDSIINPGSMGFYNYLKFMECYSQVCALDGTTSGVLWINDEKIDFDGGKIYIEKNWGKSFPIEWIWIQSNSFRDNGTSITCSLAKIPFPIKSFTGFLIALVVENKLYKFTTINRSKYKLSISHNDVNLTITRGNLKLFIQTETNKDDFILCHGPKNGVMEPFVRETLIGKVRIKLINSKTNTIIYEGVGINTGIEFGGELITKY